MSLADGDKATITTSETDLADLAQRLTAWLSRQVQAEVVLDDLRRPENSGMSSISILFTASWDDQGTRRRAELVARLAPEETALPVFPGYDLQRQYDVMVAVREHSGIPVPAARWVEPSPDVLGQPFLVMERVDGQVPVDNPPYVFGGWLTELGPEDQRELQENTVDVLAVVHTIGTPQERFPSLLPEAGLRAHFERERAYYEWSRRDDGLRIPVIEDAFTWLEDNWPAAPSPDVLCWGDARIGNVMYDGTTPVGVLDWEMACLAPRELDLGWFIFFHRMFQDIADVFELPGLPTMFRRDDVVARYEQTSGCEVRDLDFFLTYAALRHAIVMSRIHRRRIHFGEVPRPEDPNSYVLHEALLRELTDGTCQW